MTTDTPDRDKPRDYPCPYYITTGHITCNPDQPDCAKCEVLVVYRELIKLRNDMRKLRSAVLGGLPPEVAAYVYRNVTTLYAERGNAEAERRFNALADVVAELGA